MTTHTPTPDVTVIAGTCNWCERKAFLEIGLCPICIEMLKRCDRFDRAGAAIKIAAHDDLVVALRGFLAWADRYRPPLNPDSIEMLERARAALAKAGVS